MRPLFLSTSSQFAINSRFSRFIRNHIFATDYYCGRHISPCNMYSYKFNPFLTSALDEGGWSVPGFGHFRFGRETRYLIYRRLCWPRSRSGRVRRKVILYQCLKTYESFIMFLLIIKHCSNIHSSFQCSC